MNSVIALFVRHPTAANLLMAVLLATGALALSNMNRQLFPDFDIDVVTVSVKWPGAGAEDMDSLVVEAIEPEVRFLDGVEKVISSSSEGYAYTQIHFEPGTNMRVAQAQVDAAVSRIESLPEDSGKPRIQQAYRYDTLMRVVLSGDVPERALRSWAGRMRDGLIEAGIDVVELVGVRDEEILVEVDQRHLLAVDLTIAEISNRIAGVLRNIPGGNTGGRTVSRVRSLGQAHTAEQVAAVEIKAFPDGRKVTLDEIAEVRESWARDGIRLHVRGQPAIELIVKRATTADAIETAETAARFLESFVPTLPPGLSVIRYDRQAELIDERLDLLVESGLAGLAIVLGILFVFLNARAALWVAVGIPTAVFAALAFAWSLGVSLNTVSLIALIMAIGLVVDDSLVMAEHIDASARRGGNPTRAAVQGVRRMTAPVVASSLTTIAAFLPVIFMGGAVGQAFRDLPIVIVLALVASSVECFLILPAHMRHAIAAGEAAANRAGARLRRRFDDGFRRFREGPFRRIVRYSLDRRYLLLSSAIGILIVSAGLVASGRVGFVFFPSPEANQIYTNLRMAPGVSREQTLERLFGIERDAHAAAASFGHAGLVRTTLVFSGAERYAGGLRGVGHHASDTLGTVVVELEDSGRRKVRTEAFVRAWRRQIGTVVGAEAVTVHTPTDGPPSREIDVRISGDGFDDLKAAAQRVKALLSSYPGVSAVSDDLAYGRPEMRLQVTPTGRALGFDVARVGNQVRSALEGDVAGRFSRNGEEVAVRVRRKADPGGVSGLYLFAPDGTEVPLSAVATATLSQGHDIVRRERGVREIAVTAEVDEAVTNNNAIYAALRRDGVADIAADAGLEMRFAGRAEEQRDAFANLEISAAVALAGMFIVMAWVFGSYARPLAVLSVVPFGFIGVAWGHFLAGFDLTMLSVAGLVGLSGIIINDAIVLVTSVAEHERSGRSLVEAVEAAACDRLRAVFLTSVTTIGGLLPLCFETSIQVQVLIPIALTMVTGLGTATVLVLFILPAMLCIGSDARNLAGRWFSGTGRAAAVPKDAGAGPDTAIR